MELSKKRESVPDLAPMLWHSFGTIVALLQEIINIYPSINPPTLTAHQSNRVCNALALLQWYLVLHFNFIFNDIDLHVLFRLIIALLRIQIHDLYF